MTKNELLTMLHGDASAKPDNFERLNPGIGSRALPGEMIVVADPNSLECTTEENDLMQVAQHVNSEVRQFGDQEAQFVVDHYDLLEVMTSNAATGLGVGATMIGQQIKSINSTLNELEVLHQDPPCASMAHSIIRSFLNSGNDCLPSWISRLAK
ncbi:MAG: hypothetical protein V7760_03745 [Marinobacter sp.]